MTAMPREPRTVDEHLAGLSRDKRTALAKLRKAIRAAAPGAEECISYRLAAFRLDGKMLVAFGATASHCAFYLMSSSTVKAHQDELKGYDTSKGTIRFQAHNSLPDRLVRKLVKARMEENAARRMVAPVDPRFAPVVDALARDRRVSYGGKGFGSSALKLNGKIFAMMSSKGKFVVKLPKDRVDELVRLGVGRYFDPGHGRLMKEWLAVDVGTGSWVELAREARAAAGKSERRGVRQ